MVVEAIDRTRELTELIGADHELIGRLNRADQRCSDGRTTIHPCGICDIQDVVSLIRVRQGSDIAKKVVELCCPAGKMPAYLEYKLAAIAR